MKILLKFLIKKKPNKQPKLIGAGDKLTVFSVDPAKITLGV